MERIVWERDRFVGSGVIGFALTAVLALFLFAWPGGAAFAEDACDANTGENGPTVLDGTSRDDACIAGGNGPDILEGRDRISSSAVLAGTSCSTTGRRQRTSSTHPARDESRRADVLAATGPCRRPRGTHRFETSR